MSDLTDELDDLKQLWKDMDKGHDVPSFYLDRLSDSIDTIEALSSKNEEQALVIRELVEALEPFARDFHNYPNRFFWQVLVCPEGDDGDEAEGDYGPNFARARAAIAKAKP